MSHPLPDDVLIELGKVTWAAIGLEDFADGLCAFIRYTNPREDRRSIGKKIEDARTDLRSWAPEPEVDQIDAWLTRAGEALELRNAMFHAVPLVASDSNSVGFTYAFGEMPRRGRSYLERPLRVRDLREVRVKLEAAQQDWRDVALLASRKHP